MIQRPFLSLVLFITFISDFNEGIMFYLCRRYLFKRLQTHWKTWSSYQTLEKLSNSSFEMNASFMGTRLPGQQNCRRGFKHYRGLQTKYDSMCRAAGVTHTGVDASSKTKSWNRSLQLFLALNSADQEGCTSNVGIQSGEGTVTSNLVMRILRRSKSSVTSNNNKQN